jgi:hypothetical protein
MLQQIMAITDAMDANFLFTIMTKIYGNIATVSIGKKDEFIARHFYLR